MDIRDILDEIEAFQKQKAATARGESPADTEVVFHAHATPFQRLSRLVDADADGTVLRLWPALRLMGTHYRFLMSDRVWDPETAVNIIDSIWLKCARRLAGRFPAAARSATKAKLQQFLRTRLGFGAFADEVLKHRGRDSGQPSTVLAQQQLPAIWQTLLNAAELPTALDRRDIIRATSRWLGAMSFVWEHVIGGREVVNFETLATSDEKAAAAAVRLDLERLLTERAKALPDQFRDGIHTALRTYQMPVDAATFYEALNPQHGSCDINMVLKTTAHVNMEQLDMLSRWVPWVRPPPTPGTMILGEKKLRSLAPNEAPVWLRELWHLMVFGFFFHSTLSEEAGQLGVSTNVLATEYEGLFFERYCVMWWDITRAIGASACNLRERHHCKALPVVFCMGPTQFWLRTEAQIVICHSVAEAVVAWFARVTQLEDGVEVHEACRAFLPSLPAKPQTQSADEAEVAPLSPGLSEVMDDAS